MNGDWVVHLADGNHNIHAEVSTNGFTSRVKLFWDGALLESSIVWMVLGDIKSFQRNGHSFVAAVRGFGLLGRLVLSMDGVELPPVGTPAPVQSTQPPAPASVEFINELNVQESDEIVGTEEYPLDNRFGDQAFTTVRQVSRESTNELSIDTSSNLSGKVGFEIFSAIKAEIEAQVSHQTGQKIGEKVTESQTLNFSVGPKSSVVYQVVWKRKVRTGQRLYRSSGNSVTVPYRMNYGLSCEIRTQALAAKQ